MFNISEQDLQDANNPFVMKPFPQSPPKSSNENFYDCLTPEFTSRLEQISYGISSEYDPNFNYKKNDGSWLKDISTKHYQEDVEKPPHIQRQSKKIKHEDPSGNGSSELSVSVAWNHLRGTVFRLYLNSTSHHNLFVQMFGITKKDHAEFATKERNAYFFAYLYQDDAEGFIKEVISLSQFIEKLNTEDNHKLSEKNKIYFKNHRSEATFECLGFKKSFKEVIDKIVAKQLEAEDQIFDDDDQINRKKFLDLMTSELQKVKTEYELKNWYISLVYDDVYFLDDQ